MNFGIFVPLIFSNCESTCGLTEVLVQFMIEKPRPDLLTLATTFYDVSVLCNRFLKARKAQIWVSGNKGVKRAKNFGRGYGNPKIRRLEN